MFGSKSHRQLMNMKLLALAALIAIAGTAPAAAQRSKWVDGSGMSCWAACKANRVRVDLLETLNDVSLYTCWADPGDGDGPREGFNGGVEGCLVQEGYQAPYTRTVNIFEYYCRCLYGPSPRPRR